MDFDGMVGYVSDFLTAFDEEEFVFGSGTDPIGVRRQSVPFESGEFDHLSSRWDDETGELGPLVDADGYEVDGVSVIGFDGPDVGSVRDALERVRDYVGDHIGILVGDSCVHGEDPDELVLTGDVECILVIR